MSECGFRIADLFDPSTEVLQKVAELHTRATRLTMNKKDFQDRTKKLALRTARLVSSLPNSVQAQVFGRQLLRSSSSVAANYRAACRARSTAEFLSKLSIVEEEADESLFWLELISDAGLVQKEKIADLLDEANQVVSIIVASIRTAKRRTSR